MCHHPLLFLRLESLSHRQVHIFPGWVIWCSIMQMTSSILALLKLVIKSMTYGYSSIRGTNTLYVKHIGFVEIQCASAIWYETDNISSCLLLAGVSSVLPVAFTIMMLPVLQIHFCVYSHFWTLDLPNGVVHWSSPWTPLWGQAQHLLPSVARCAGRPPNMHF